MFYSFFPLKQPKTSTIQPFRDWREKVSIKSASAVKYKFLKMSSANCMVFVCLIVCTNRLYRSLYLQVRVGFCAFIRARLMHTRNTQRRCGLDNWAGQKVANFRTEDIMSVRYFNFVPKFPQNWVFLATDLVFLDENFPTKKFFPTDKNFGVGLGQLPLPLQATVATGNKYRYRYR